MSDEDELGDLLRTSLRDLVADISPSQALQDDILAIAQPPARKTLQRFKQPRALAATFASAIAAAIAIISLSQTAVTPSFAVTIEPNHTVKVTLYQLSGAPGANARLKALGVHAIIVPINTDCPTRIATTYIGISENPAPTIRLTPGNLPDGGTLILAAQKIGANHIEMAIGRVTRHPPTCVKPGTGPGLTGSHHPAGTPKS